MTDQNEPAERPINDMRELYAVQHAITDAGGTLTPAVHQAIDALRETWDRGLRRAQAALADRPAVLRAETAETLRSDLYDDLDAFARQTGIPGLQHAQIRDHLAVFLTEGLLRRMADEAQQAEAQAPVAPEAPAVCEGFQWIGQSFATCDRCGQPAWEHAGEDVPVEGAGPFDNRRTVRPWEPGETDAIRAKWEPAAGAQQPEVREWCKCPSCWGWFVEDHPGEDLDELGRDLGWWSGLPEHRDAPAAVGAQQPKATP